MDGSDIDWEALDNELDNMEAEAGLEALASSYINRETFYPLRKRRARDSKKRLHCLHLFFFEKDPAIHDLGILV